MRSIDEGAVAQERFLRARLRKDLRRADEVLPSVTVATVDAFQGREADVVIFSCVRAPRYGTNWPVDTLQRGGVGFLADVRRMNVGLTRARRALWVVGHAGTLARSAPWRALLEHADQCGTLYAAEAEYSAALRHVTRRPLSGAR
jgi:superfamily I DNA and/or RNA helicase